MKTPSVLCLISCILASCNTPEPNTPAKANSDGASEAAASTQSSSATDASPKAIAWGEVEAIFVAFSAAFQGQSTDCDTATATVEKLLADNAVLLKATSKDRSRRGFEIGVKYMTTLDVQAGIQRCLRNDAFRVANAKLKASLIPPDLGEDLDWVAVETMVKGVASVFHGTDTDCEAAATTIDKIATDNSALIKRLLWVENPRVDQLVTKYMKTQSIEEGSDKCIGHDAFANALKKFMGFESPPE